MYFNQSVEDALKALKSSERGLNKQETQIRLMHYGKNEIKHIHKISPWKVLFAQFKSFLVYILIGAFFISAILGYNDYKAEGGSLAMQMADAITILAILIINAILGFLQEYRAEKSIEALRELSSPKAKVIRDGQTEEIDARDIVPGDILLVEVGDKIPADARLIELSELQTQESALTGESLPIKKELKMLSNETSVADRKNMIFAGTTVTNGHSKAVVTKTGMNTQIGRIARLIQETGQQFTPLQKKLKVLGEWLGGLTILICVLVVIGGILRGGDIFGWLLIGVSLAVAAIPEGLPAVVTISLALGIERMIKKNSLIRKLPSVETLGATTVICTDKTGTLTCNQMTVTRIYANGKIYEVTGAGYSRTGGFMHKNRLVPADNLNMMLKIGALCNNAELVDGKVIGDPTEGALLVSAGKAGIRYEETTKRNKRIDEIGFTSERKMMSTLNRVDEKAYVFSKGAPEIIVRHCDRILVDGEVKAFTDSDKKKVLEMNEIFAKDALRVLGMAYKQSNRIDENRLIFAGLQGMMDPPRNEARASIEKCHKAGVRVVMITGDYEVTANAIASKLGIKGKSLSGTEIDRISNLEKYVDDINIYARVNPEHKIKIVNALQKKGHIVAMTGDGVNDAPALKKADIGVAMGISGTDVAKEASDMILTDDNFTSIVKAVEEGRGIYDNIKKFVNYLLSSNLGEVLILFTAMIIGFSAGNGALILPLTALQILWMNIVTDGLPALALGLDPTDPEVMKRQPRNPKEHIISKNMTMNILVIGVLMTVSVLYLFKSNLDSGNIVLAQTMAFTSMVVLQIVRVYMVRMKYHIGIFSNRWLLGAIASSIMLQLAVVYTPLNKVFGTVPLGMMHWVQIIMVCAIMLAVGLSASMLIRGFTHEAD